jgi:ApbE superfamily uncharacterized protein (UPF0280 family)
MAQYPLQEITRELVIRYRGYIEAYIRRFPEFSKTLVPWAFKGPVPQIIRQMTIAGQKAGVGPMAAVAGAIAESVGRELLAYSDEVIIENGGDVYLKTKQTETLAIYAGQSPLSMRVGLRVKSVTQAVAVCTSSGTIGHSYSSGRADAVCVLSDDCALADAAATAIGNRITTTGDLSQAIGFGQKIADVRGIVLIIGEQIGMWGDMEVVPI